MLCSLLSNRAILGINTTPIKHFKYKHLTPHTMTNLVYFASGPLRKEYFDLDYDRIFLVDNCFRDSIKNTNRVVTKGKITCLGMDCLESIAYLKDENVKIDCFVSLNEGLYEGGGSYAINSDFFLGYAMPLLSDEYIHIMNPKYYHNNYKTAMDLPYHKVEIDKDDANYINPLIFSKAVYQKRAAKVYKMTSIKSSKTHLLDNGIQFTIHHNSIWNHYEQVDLLVLSLEEQGQKHFFTRLDKVIDVRDFSVEVILKYCMKHKISRIGFTPWNRLFHVHFMEKISQCNQP